MIEGIHFTNLNGLFKSKYCPLFDPILGFSRIDDIVGFKRFGTNDGKLLRIVTLGGSTTDFSYSGIQSWPELLHEHLNAQGVPNVIYNGGISGYMSAQERDKFIRDVLPLKPHIVLCLSGINDVSWNHCRKDAPHYPSYMVEQVFTPSLENSKKDYTLGYSPELSDYANWYDNQSLIGGIASEFGIKYHCFLQPCIFSGHYLKSEFEDGWLSVLLKDGLMEHRAVKRIYEGWRSFYDGADRLIRENPFIHDFSCIFDGFSGVYLDGIHCSLQGNRIIMERIFEYL